MAGATSSPVVHDGTCRAEDAHDHDNQPSSWGAFHRRRAFEHFAKTRRRLRRKTHAFLSHAVQLYARNVGTAGQESGGPSRRRPAVHRIRGRKAVGDHDAYNLWEAPDDVSMAATAIAISAGGALSSLHTTVLLTVEETVAALQKAASIRYRQPGEKV